MYCDLEVSIAGAGAGSTWVRGTPRNDADEGASSSGELQVDNVEGHRELDVS